METELGNYLGFDIGMATQFAYDDDGFPFVQVDAYGEEKSGVDPYQLHSPHGYLSVPLDPDTDGNGKPTLGCSVLYALEGGRGHAWLSHDPRVIIKLPILKPGEALLYNSLGQFVRLDAKGAITLFTTDDGTPDGRSVYLQVGKDALLFVAPWGMLRFDNTGFHAVTASGARLDMGAIGGIPLVGNYARLRAGMVSLDGQAVSTGPTGGIGPEPTALALPLVQLLTQIITALTVIGPAPLPAPAAAALAAQLQGIVGKSSSG